jgi:hypothetical protein
MYGSSRFSILGRMANSNSNQEIGLEDLAGCPNKPQAAMTDADYA